MADDLINLDIYFAGIIAAKLREFKEQETGYPGNYSHQGQWNAHLDSIIVPLERYVGKFDLPFEVENEVTRAAQQAMRDLADIFPSLWM